MPTYKITGPDGKTYNVTGEGSAEDALKQVQQQVQRGGSLTAREPSIGDKIFSAAGTVLGPNKVQQLRSDVGGLGAAFRGAVDGATFGTSDMVRAGMNTIDGEGDFSTNLDRARAETEFVRKQNPMGFMAGNIAGSVAPGVGALKAGVTATRFVAPTMQGVKGAVARAGANAVDGAAFGAAQALGHGEDPTIPAMVGAAAGPAGQLAAGIGRGIVRPLAARVAPQRYARLAMGKAVDRSGKTVAEIRNDLMTAGADGQGEYMLADALGNPGQRMLSTVARTPNDARAPVTDALLRRQAGQGDRLTQALSEGFAAPDTAAQRAAALKAARGDEADQLYAAARQGAGPVDINPTLQVMDDITRPGLQQVASVPSSLADDSISTQLQRFRARMANPNEQLTDFDAVLQLKREINDAADKAARSGENFRAKQLGDVVKSLDAQLQQSSQAYRTANDTFAKRSRAIDAIDQGAATTSGRVRSDDSIPAFQRLDPEAQAAFRAGYADPMIARVQNSPFGTNKARSLMSSKTGAEFPAFAAPGQADQLGRRIGRENTMFETQATALGGSKTADNLADEAGMSTLDPSIFGPLLTGNWKTAAVNAGTRSMAALSGQPANVREQLGRMLMAASPAEADAIIRQALQQQAKSQGVDDVMVRLLMAPAATGAVQVQP